MQAQTPKGLNCAIVNNEYMYDNHGNRAATSYTYARCPHRDVVAEARNSVGGSIL